VRGNLEFPLRNEGLPRAEIERRVREAAAILRIEHLLGARVGGLSAGDRQRVALGRAIVRQPKAFLMDEPLGHPRRRVPRADVRGTAQAARAPATTTVFVTHDQNEAMALADHVVVMNEGDILQADDPDGIYNFPSCLFVARFIGRPPMNLLPLAAPVSRGDTRVRLAGRDVDVPQVQAPAAGVLLGVRPEHVRLRGADQGCLGGRVPRSSTSARTGSPRIHTEAGAVKVAGGQVQPARARGPCRAWTSPPIAWCCSTPRASGCCRAPPPSPMLRGCAMASFSLHGLSKRFGAVQALADISLDVADGEFFVLLGQSGAGKTTTLRVIAGPGASPTAAAVRMDGEGRDGCRTGPARLRLRVPAVLAVPAPHRLRQPGLSRCGRRSAPCGGRDPAAGGARRRHAAHHRQARPQGHRALGRRDAARRHRPRPGARARACT
jgi:ABC-type sugar transport system ATPase subunit